VINFKLANGKKQWAKIESKIANCILPIANLKFTA
jgi:hypothetical protein